jgi:copper transporter 1
MDHGNMDHGNMDHGTMPGHGGMDDMCQMSMLFTWNTKNLCIVFKWWHIRSALGLWISLLAVVAIGMGYEALREGIRRYEVWAARRADAVPRKFPPPFLLLSFSSHPVEEG